jgi:hypothetical protein
VHADEGAETDTKPYPRLQLETLFITDARRRIVSTREPRPTPGPAFAFIRGESDCAWGVRADVPDDVARELDRLAAEEPPSAAWDRPFGPQTGARPFCRGLQRRK